MLDTSSSMEQDVRAAAGAAIQFVSALDEAASVTFVEFDANVRIGRFTPASYPQLFERIRQVRSRRHDGALRRAGDLPRTAPRTARASTSC